MDKLPVFDYNFPSIINMGRQFSIYFLNIGFEDYSISSCSYYSYNFEVT
jgi:hypothetical protein